MAMTLNKQKEAFPIGAAVVAIEGCPPYFSEGARGIVAKHYGKGSVYVRFGRSSGAMLDANGGHEWFVDVDALALAGDGNG